MVMQLNWKTVAAIAPSPCYRQCILSLNSGLHFTHGLLLHRYSKLTIAYNVCGFAMAANTN